MYSEKINMELKITVERGGSVVFSDVLTGPIRAVRACVAEAAAARRKTVALPEEMRPLLEENEKVVFKCEMEGEPTRYYVIFFRGGTCQLRELVSIKGRKSVKLADGSRL